MYVYIHIYIYIHKHIYTHIYICFKYSTDSCDSQSIVKHFETDEQHLNDISL